MSAARAVGLLLGVAADSVLARPPAGSRLRGARGAAAAALLVAGAVAVERAGRRAPVLQATTTGVATWAALGAASLAAEGAAMARALDASDVTAARATLPRLAAAGGDGSASHADVPDRLDPAGLARAAVESVAENTSDAVVAPLLWGAVAGVPGLLGYRAVQAFDAAGARTAAGGAHGGSPAAGCGLTARAAVVLDDVANLVPARAAAALAAACAPIVGGSAPGAWTVWRRDGSAHPRPNHGQVEAAFAGALEVRLGGVTVADDGPRRRPVLGHGRLPDAGDVTRGVELSRVVGAVAAVGAAVVAVVAGTAARRRA